MRELILSGRLAANAEVKATKSGIQYVEFRIANNEYTRGVDNNGKETYWFRVVSFNTNHVKLVPYLTKGKPVEVIGKLQVSPYISNTTNKAEAGLEVMANDIMFDNNFGNQQQNTNDGATHQTDNAQEYAKAVQTPRNPSTTTISSVVTTTKRSADNVDDDLPF